MSLCTQYDTVSQRRLPSTSQGFIWVFIEDTFTRMQIQELPECKRNYFLKELPQVRKWMLSGLSADALTEWKEFNY